VAVFGYESDENEGISFELERGPVFFSPLVVEDSSSDGGGKTDTDGSSQDNESESEEEDEIEDGKDVRTTADLLNNKLDFVAFQFEIPSDDAEYRKLKELTEHQMYWHENIGNIELPEGSTAIMIGHPQGGYKCGVVTELTQRFHTKDMNTWECTITYDIMKSRPVNSGSPVFFVNNYVSADAVGALHYYSGRAIAFVGGIAESLRKQFGETNENEITMENYLKRSVLQKHYELKRK
jgi:hypothetical protein